MCGGAMISNFSKAGRGRQLTVDELWSELDPAFTGQPNGPGHLGGRIPPQKPPKQLSKEGTIVLPFLIYQKEFCLYFLGEASRVASWVGLHAT